MEGSGEDPYLGAQMAAARVRGFPGPEPGVARQRSPPAPSTTPLTARRSRARLQHGRHLRAARCAMSCLPPFKAAADAGAATFMNSFNEIGGIPATGSVHLQRDILQGRMGLRGLCRLRLGLDPRDDPARLLRGPRAGCPAGDHRRQRHGHGVARLHRPARQPREVRQGGCEAGGRRGAAGPAGEVRAGPLRRPLPVLRRGSREGRHADAGQSGGGAGRRAQVDRAAEERRPPAARQVQSARSP